MKKMFIFLVFVLLSVSACSFSAYRGAIVSNSCDLISDYADCTAIELSQSTIEMTILLVPEVSVTNIIFELPNLNDEENIIYCSTDVLSTEEGSNPITVDCDLSEYAGTNTQLNFVATLEVTDSLGTVSTVTVEGQAEDYVEE
ncbi:MAG: hypothetical protein WC254_05920 [Candidatus Woesearchaeota archaeon]